MGRDVLRDLRRQSIFPEIRTVIIPPIKSLMKRVSRYRDLIEY